MGILFDVDQKGRRKIPEDREDTSNIGLFYRRGCGVIVVTTLLVVVVLVNRGGEQTDSADADDLAVAGQHDSDGKARASAALQQMQEALPLLTLKGHTEGVRSANEPLDKPGVTMRVNEQGEIRCRRAEQNSAQFRRQFAGGTSDFEWPGTC